MTTTISTRLDTISHDAPRSLSPDLLRRMDAYWRAANYLSVGGSAMICLVDLLLALLQQSTRSF